MEKKAKMFENQTQLMEIPERKYRKNRQDEMTLKQK